VSIDATLAELREEQRAIRAELHAITAALEQIKALLPAQLVTVPEAARALGMCPTTVQRLARAGKLPATRRGRKWLVDLSKIRPVDADQVVEAAAAARGLRAIGGER
jgi:excisionase family DNA binding protein